uniref:Tse2 family ADP-ribosyltransferase toxin n=1 Tax=Frigoriglobus tundricola TaxID=2774151 RepID=UPI00148ECFA8|nr:hypothetical protein [Frigoriglobus tundricola]
MMKVAADGKPQVGTSGSMLGVRPTDPNNLNPNAVADVAAVDDTDLVKPGEGLSTSPNPHSRQPRRNQAVFEIETDDLDPVLKPNPDKPDHCLLEPSQPMSLEEYQRALADTRDLWQQVQ